MGNVKSHLERTLRHKADAGEDMDSWVSLLKDNTKV